MVRIRELWGISPAGMPALPGGDKDSRALPVMAKTASIDGDKQHAPVIFGICAVMTAVFLLVQWFGFAQLKEAEGYFQDWSARLGRKTRADSRLVLMGIDRPGYDDMILAGGRENGPV